MRPCKLVVLLALTCLSVGSRQEAKAVLKSNKMRYANREDHLEPSESIPIEQVAIEPNAVINDYRINQREVDSDKNAPSLDSEDRDLLEKFYRETRGRDPFLGDHLSSELLWDEKRDQELDSVSALLDLRDGRQGYQQHYQPEGNGWTIDPELVEQSKMLSSQHLLPSGVSLGIVLSDSQQQQADYSPTLKLLTSYDPYKQTSTGYPGNNESDEREDSRANRIVGATLSGSAQTNHAEPLSISNSFNNYKLNVSSRSPADALKMHDELFRRPPNDGRVRVRMYFHRAIHDDLRLYGNGPWKYWGHGWGVEFGYKNPTAAAGPAEASNGLPSDAPNNPNNPSDFYQRGYTIERAYGRDFCRDRRNCRRPDPNFFSKPQRLSGRYSSQPIVRHRESRPPNVGYNKAQAVRAKF